MRLLIRPAHCLEEFEEMTTLQHSLLDVFIDLSAHVCERKYNFTFDRLALRLVLQIVTQHFDQGVVNFDHLAADLPVIVLIRTSDQKIHGFILIA